MDRCERRSIEASIFPRASRIIQISLFMALAVPTIPGQDIRLGIGDSRVRKGRERSPLEKGSGDAKQARRRARRAEGSRASFLSFFFFFRFLFQGPEAG